MIQSGHHQQSSYNHINGKNEVMMEVDTNVTQHANVSNRNARDVAVPVLGRKYFYN